MSCFHSLTGTRDGPEAQSFIQGFRKVGEQRGRGNNIHSAKKEEMRKRLKRGERGVAEAVPQAARRQLAQRCARPIFSFPHAHLAFKQLLKHSYTEKTSASSFFCRQLLRKLQFELQLRTSSGVSPAVTFAKSYESRPSALFSSGCCLPPRVSLSLL